MRVEIADGDIMIDAEELAPLLNVAATDLPRLMRSNAVTSICERGVGADEGHYRLSFFYRNRRIRLNVDPNGRVTRRMTIDFGERSLPPQLHRPGS